MQSTVDSKWLRFQNGERLRVLDLFAGAGGLSLGFDAAGFELIGGVEFDDHAAFTHGTNFFGATDPSDPHAVARDITDTTPASLFKDLGYEESPAEKVDIIIGGPPCQAFARVGRAKLREVADHPEAFLKDPRASLYASYIEYVKDCQPLALVMENVPDILNFGGKNVAEEVCELLDELGYASEYTLLNSAFFGVPQMRERMFLVAIHKSIKADFSFPAPTHFHKLPPGYEGTRSVALKGMHGNLDRSNSHFCAVDRPEVKARGLKPAVSAEDALGDLPEITIHLEGGLKRGARRFTELVEYPGKPSTPYQKLMRTWKGFENEDGIKDHVIRSLPRDYPIFAAMKAGDQYPQAHAASWSLFKAKLHKMDKPPKEGSAEWVALRDSIVPPYDPSKFPNKWRKMEPDSPSRTLMAHLGKDSYSHIHYESNQARTISVREAARLQSFPDGFVFRGTMNPAFRQIGNAVPPLLSAAVAEALITALRAAIPLYGVQVMVQTN